LRLDLPEHVQRGGETGPLVAPGKPDESLLIQQVSGEKPAMPPKRPPIGAEQIALLRQWIVQGAKIDSMPADPATAVFIPQIYEYAPAINSVALDRDGRRAACACRSEIAVVSLTDDAPPLRLPTESDLLSYVEFSSDGTLLAAAGGTPALFGEVRFWDANTGALISSRRIGTDTLFRGSFAPDGKSIALGGADGAVYVVPVDVTLPVKRFELHSDWVLDVAWTPDGTKLISVGRDKTTKAASAESGQLLRTIDTSTERVAAVVVDDKRAVSAGLARTVMGYELGVALQNIEVSGAGNGARPISRRDQFMKPFEAQSGEVLDLALSGDRRVLAVAGRYGEVRLYTFADQKPLAKIAAVPQPVFAIALNSDGTQLVVGSKTGLFSVYQLPAGTLVKSIAPVPVRNIAAGARR
jgi:WD40 repeat protein